MKRKIISIFIMAMGVISLHDISIKAMSVEAYSVEKNVENQKNIIIVDLVGEHWRRI